MSGPRDRSGNAPPSALVSKGAMVSPPNVTPIAEGKRKRGEPPQADE